MGQTAQNPFQDEVVGFETVQVDEISNISLLRNRQNKQEILIRKWIFNEKQECNKIYQLHALRQMNSTQYLQQLIKFTPVKTQDLCNTMHQLYCMWEYQPTSLSCQIQKRLHTNQQFTHKQIASIIISVSEALRAMETKNIKHEKLTVDSIKVDDKGNIKVCDPLSLAAQPNYSRVYSKHETDRIYLSPQQCAFLSSTQHCHRSSKSDVWTFGMILLELGLLEDQNSCYREECRRIQWNRIADNLGRFGAIYGSCLKQLIETMLAKDSSSRPGWNKIKSTVTQNLREQQQQSIKAHQFKLANNKKSPQVYAYKQFSQPNSQIFPLNRQVIYPAQLPVQNHFYPPPRQQVHHVNITYNQPVNRSEFGQNKENMGLVMHNRPPLPHLPYLPSTSQISIMPNQPIPNPNQLNVPSIMSITASKIHSQDNVKKFMSSASSIGLLFPGINQKQEPKQAVTSQTEQKIAQTQYIPSDYGSKNNYPHNRFCNNQIKNAESITYEGDFQNVLVHQFRNLDVNKQGEPVEKSNKQFQAIDLKSMPAISTQAQNPQFSEPDELEYVVQNFKVGSRYEGYKLRNMRHGEGRFYYQDGGMYDGTWHHNKMNGKGSLYYQSGGLAYEGNWKNDQFEGRGRLNNQVPEVLDKNFDYRNFDNIGQAWEYYDGQFVDDMKQGRGKLMLTNGEYYVGNFSEDMIDGNGKFFSKNGVIKGVWEANQLIKIQ